MIVNYDGDSAGRTAAARAVPLGFEKGLNVEVLVLPDDLDPDAFLKKHGRDKYLALQKKTVSGLKFLIDSLAQGRPDVRPRGKGPDRPGRGQGDREGPRPHGQERIPAQASQELRVEEGLLRSIIEQKAPQAGPDMGGAFCPGEKRLLQILMEDRSVAPYVFAECGEEIFQGSRSEPVFRYILECFKNDKDWNIHELKDKVPPAVLSQLVKGALRKTAGAASVEEAQECLKSLRKLHLENRLKDIQQKIARLEKQGGEGGARRAPLPET